MKVLGISGLEASSTFKRANFPGLEEREYRIAQGMDSAAALIIDGQLIAAAEEERFTAKKHTGDFPIHAINFCLAEAGISINDIDEIAHGFDYTPLPQPLRRRRSLRPALSRRLLPRSPSFPGCPRSSRLSRNQGLLRRPPHGPRRQRRSHLRLG